MHWSLPNHLPARLRPALELIIVAAVSSSWLAPAIGAEVWDPPPPFDVETMEPVRPPWRALKEWIPVDNPEDEPDWFDQSNPWRPREILQDDRILVLDAD